MGTGVVEKDALCGFPQCSGGICGASEELGAHGDQSQEAAKVWRDGVQRVTISLEASLSYGPKACRRAGSGYCSICKPYFCML